MEQLRPNPYTPQPLTSPLNLSHPPQLTHLKPKNLSTLTIESGSGLDLIVDLSCHKAVESSSTTPVRPFSPLNLHSPNTITSSPKSPTLTLSTYTEPDQTCGTPKDMLELDIESSLIDVIEDEERFSDVSYDLYYDGIIHPRKCYERGILVRLSFLFEMRECEARYIVRKHRQKLISKGKVEIYDERKAKGARVD